MEKAEDLPAALTDVAGPNDVAEAALSSASSRLRTEMSHLGVGGIVNSGSRNH